MALLLALLARRLAGRRIRNRELPPGQVRGEILASLRTVFVFSLMGFLVYIGGHSGVLTIYANVSDFGWGYFAASIILAIVAQDAYFYWTHRAMHHPALFRIFHRRHHRSVVTTPWTAYSFDVPEAIVQSAFLPLFLLVVPMHSAAIFVFVMHMIVRNVMGHSGYELLPRRLADSRWWGWTNSVTHHDLHHETFRWNYALYFTWWDRWMGTEHPEYRARLRGLTKAVVGVAFLSVAVGVGDLHAADPVMREWATQGFSARVRIEECEDARLCGRIMWLWKASDEQGNPVKDENNANAAQRNRKLVGSQILGGFRREENGAWVDGWIYNPEDGKTYSATLRVGTTGELKLRGCVLGVFCKNQLWRPVEQICRGDGASSLPSPAGPRGKSEKF